MKNCFILLVTIITMALCSCGGHGDSFRLNGELKGFQDNSIYIYSESERHPQIDTVSVSEGRFIYEINVDTVVPLTLLLNNGKDDFVIFADKGYQVTLTGNPSIPSSLKVSGGKLNDEMNTFRAQVSCLKDDTAIKNAAETYIKSHPTSDISVYLLNKYFIQQGEDKNKIQSLIAGLNGRLQDGYIIQRVLDQLSMEKSSEVDANAPTFFFQRPGEAPVSNYDFNNKILLIQFWASWDAKSISMMKTGVELGKQYGSNKLAVLNVSLDLDKTAWKREIAGDSLSMRKNVCDFNGWEGSMVKSYGISKIPSNVLVNDKQKIVGRDLFGKELTDRLSALTASIH